MLVAGSYGTIHWQPPVRGRRGSNVPDPMPTHACRVTSLLVFPPSARARMPALRVAWPSPGRTSRQRREGSSCVPDPMPTHALRVTSLLGFLPPALAWPSPRFRGRAARQRREGSSCVPDPMPTHAFRVTSHLGVLPSALARTSALACQGSFKLPGRSLCPAAV